MTWSGILPSGIYTIVVEPDSFDDYIPYDTNSYPRGVVLSHSLKYECPCGYSGTMCELINVPSGFSIGAPLHEGSVVSGSNGFSDLFDIDFLSYDNLILYFHCYEYKYNENVSPFHYNHIHYRIITQWMNLGKNIENFLSIYMLLEVLYNIVKRHPMTALNNILCKFYIFFIDKIKLYQYPSDSFS
jgi:hypothetical protein